MNINFISPFSMDKKYGTELNRCISLLPDDDWVCVTDWDCMLLSPLQVPKMYEYIAQYPEVDLFLATSNRSGSHSQRYKGRISGDDSMKAWHLEAENLLKGSNSITLNADGKISGYLMLFSKRTWEKYGFSNDLDVLHVDRDFTRKILEQNGVVAIMNRILVWHSYRLLHGTQNKEHLKA